MYEFFGLLDDLDNILINPFLFDVVVNVGFKDTDVKNRFFILD